MIGVIRSELMRLRRGSFVFGGVGLLAGFSALISIFVLSAAGEEAGDGPGPASTRSVAELEAPGGSLASFETLSNLVGVVVLAYWAIAVASDYGTGLIRILAQAEPRRLRLLGGKVIALVAATVAGTAIVTLVATALARPLAELNDVSSDRWSTDFAIEVLGSFAKLTVSALVWGLVGLLVAVISRSSGVAIAVGVGDLLVVENLVSIVAEGASDYLPGRTLAAVVAGGTADLGDVAALALAAAYALAAGLAAAVVFRSRDIVSSRRGRASRLRGRRAEKRSPPRSLRRVHYARRQPRGWPRTVERGPLEADVPGDNGRRTPRGAEATVTSTAQAAPAGQAVVRPWLVLGASCTALLIIAANTTSINAAVNNLSDDLSLSANQLTWVVNAYLLGAAMVVASAGKLGDFIGVRAIFLIGLLAFAIGSVAVALAEGATLITAGRAIQGVGSGFLMPATMSAIGLGIPPERRGVANGVWGAVAGIGFALGPLYGGTWTELLSWRGIFWADLVVIVFAALLAWWALGPLPRPGGKGRIDLGGAVIFGLAMFAIVFAGQGVQQFGLDSPLFIGAVVVPVVLLAAFAEYEQRRHPADRLLDFALLAKPAYWGANVVVFTSTAVLLAILYFFNLYAQSPVVFDQSAIDASVALLPYGVALFVVSLIAGRLTDTFGFRIPVTVGMAVTAVGLFLLGAASLEDSLPDLLFPLGLAGAGAGATFATSGAAAMAVAPPEQAGEAAGTANTSRYMGAALGVAVASSLYATAALDTFKTRLAALGIGPAEEATLEDAITGSATALTSAIDTTPNADRAGVESAAEAAITDGFAAAMVFVGAIAVVGAVVGALTLRGRAR